MNHILADAVGVFFTALYVMLFARIILSWFPMRDSRLMELLYAFTEPILAPVRNLLRRSPLGGPGMVLDFSPLIVFLLLRIVGNAIVGILRSL
ncbi:MAG: YggT family protein [Defluviitaleaceae bacterium]|nr:YggT family protein [Defluviitaleaceae bacterium]